MANQSLDEFSADLLLQPSCVGNVAAQAPEDLIQLTDDSVILEFKESFDGYLSIDILLDCGRIIPPSREAQILCLNFDRYLLESQITIGRRGVEWFSAVDLCTCS